MHVWVYTVCVHLDSWYVRCRKPIVPSRPRNASTCTNSSCREVPRDAHPQAFCESAALARQQPHRGRRRRGSRVPWRWRRAARRQPRHGCCRCAAPMVEVTPRYTPAASSKSSSSSSWAPWRWRPLPAGSPGTDVVAAPRRWWRWRRATHRQPRQSRRRPARGRRGDGAATHGGEDGAALHASSPGTDVVGGDGTTLHAGSPV
jgi:hypothetical protein